MSLKIVFTHILQPGLIGATVSEIWRIRCFYNNDAEKYTIIKDDEKFKLISVKTMNLPYHASSYSNKS